LNPVELAYVRSSVTARDAQRAHDEARRENELALQRQSTNRLRYLIGVLMIFLVVALALSAFAFNSRTQALDSEAAAFAERNRADAASQINRSGKLAAQAVSHLGDQLDLALLLSLEANRIVATMTPQASFEARDSLLRGLETGPGVPVLRGHTGPVFKV